ncbi:hypothetical protein [Pectobacterium sp. A5351]|nr:hypothetical protein [Pectobacterium sp. A5351]WCG83585.1 hypothetical protein O1Q74_02420 [Pectobacterium sp. A5351]
MNQNLREEAKETKCAEEEHDVTFFLEGVSDELMIELLNRRC